MTIMYEYIDIPTAMKDIWGKDHSGLVLKEIAVSVSDPFFLLHSFVSLRKMVG